MHNRTKTLLLLVTLAVLTTFIYAQTDDPRGPGQALPGVFDVILQINDARAAAGLNVPLCTPWAKGLNHTKPYQFAVGKNFTLIIREMAATPVYPPVFRDYRVSAVADATGFVRFAISLPAGVDVTKKTDWYVAIVVEWPRPGTYFLIYNETFTNTALFELIGNISGRPDKNGTETRVGPWGVLRLTHGPGRFGNLSSSVIHTYYIGVNTLGKQFTLTLTRTITIAGARITLDDNVSPRTGPTNYVRAIDPAVTAVFGPFTYLATYVTSLGGVRERVSIDPTRVRLDHIVFITIEGLRGEVIVSTNDRFVASGGLRHVAITLNRTAGPGTGVLAPLSCGLVIWNLTMYTFTITGLLDLKGNPIFNPESFRFKMQLKIGDRWVTLDRAQGSWRLTLSDAASVVRQVCGSLNTIGDVLNCYRTLGPDGFRDAVLRLYEPVTLSRLAGQLRLRNNEATISHADLTTKLVVEYSYTAGQDSVKATVLEIALAEPTNYRGVLNVSVLPVQIRLWRWSDLTLPPNVPNLREFFFTDPLDLASLRFVVDGDTMYINRMAYDGAVTYDPWLGQVIWTLPPYQVVPGLVGNVRASLLSLFNASGYLPMPTLVANLTRIGGRAIVRYFNYTDVAGRADFFARYHIGLVGSYAYRFRIYSGEALVGTANVVARYPVINSSGLLYHVKAGEALEAVYGDRPRRDMYSVQIVEPGRFYDREHVIHIAIARVFQNIIMRDMCGNPVMGISAGFARATVSIVLDVGGRNVTIARLPVSSEVPVEITIPIDEWGNPLIDLKGGAVRAYAVLNYFGYTLYPADNVTKLPAKAPVYFDIPVKYGVVTKPVLYLPIAPLLFQVWSQVVSVDYDPLEEPLMGFVVRVFSTAANAEMARSISNRDGFAYAPNVPIGVPFRVQVRTIVPADDRRWSYTYEQMRRGNDYASYARALGFGPTDNVYTLGTRAEIDSGLVVYGTEFLIDATNATKYICAKDAILLPVEVYDLVVAVFDKTGTYLLRSQPVYLGPYPQATRPVLLNVTMILADDFSPYEAASIWRDRQIRDFKVLTDFRAIGITGMRTIYQRLAERYLLETQRALDCPRVERADYARAINAYALASMAGYIANASTDRYAAIFLLTSQQPKDMIDVCRIRADQVGSAEIARLFIKGQRFRFVVWYLGQKVFDDYVTITGPLVKINADVYPINVTTFTKSLRLPVDSFVGFTLTDVYVGLALNKTYGTAFSNITTASQLIAPFTDAYRVYGLSRILANELAPGTPQAYNEIVRVYANGTVRHTLYFGAYRDAAAGGDFVYLPNVALIRNMTVPKYLFTVLTTPATMERNVTRCTYRESSLRFDIVAHNNATIILNGTRIEAFAINETYVKLRSYADGKIAVLNISATLVSFGRWLREKYKTVNISNCEIDLEIVAKCGSIRVRGPEDITLNISVLAGRCPASVSYVIRNCTCTLERERIAAQPGVEYAVSFDRWFLVPYDWRYTSFNVLYHAIDVVERNDVLRVLTHTGRTQRCANFTAQIVHEEDDEYRYRLVLRGLEVVNYRTLDVVLPWSIQGDGKALVNITAFFANGTRIDSTVYNLTELLADTRSTRAFVRLPLNFGRVGTLAYHIATQNLAVRYDITFYMFRPTTQPIRVCASKLVPLAGSYREVSMYDCAVPVRPGVPEAIDPSTVVYRIDLPLSVANSFNETYDRLGGFGTPITYVVRSGEIALLPAWYHKTSVAGSRIARIWLIAANEDPCKGPALGTRYTAARVSDDKVTINIYKFEKYLVVNFVPNVCPAGWTIRTYLDEFDGEGRIAGLGFGTSGTSALVLSNYTGVAMWNSTAMWMAKGSFKLPTVALDRLTVRNNAEFPIVVDSLAVRYTVGAVTCTHNIPMAALRVDASKTETGLLNGYGFGRTYMLNITDLWAFRLVQPNYRYGLNVFHAGLVDAAKYFNMTVDRPLSAYLRPLTTAEFVQNVLYASHAASVRCAPMDGDHWSYRILNGKICEFTRGRWDVLRTDASDFDYKYVFSYPTLPLREIRDWNDRPLANQTIALFDRLGRLYAVVYSDSAGRLVYPLPDLTAMGQTNVVRVSWHFGYLVELLRARPEFTIWIYDQLIQRDVIELGDASTNSKIRTYVYPLTVTVKDETGKPLTNMYVQVIDTSTRGALVNAANVTGADGGAQVVDLRISKYATGYLSQVPATSYIYRVFDQDGSLVAVGRFEIQRGASVPAAGWNIIATVRYATEIPVRNAATRGYILVRGVEYIDGTTRDVKVPFVVSGGMMLLQGKVPVSVEYPVEIYVTHVTLGGQEVPVRGGEVRVFSGKTTDLLQGFDFAELGVTGSVTLQAVDTTGSPRSDWTIQVLYRNMTVAQGAGQLQTVLPRTDLLDAPYTIKVITNAITPAGTALVREQTFELRQRAVSLQIPVSTVRAVVQVVDGFGNLRSDFPLTIVNVASGTGQLAVELVEGERYTVRASGLGFTNETVIVARGRQMVVPVRIPTAKIVAQVVDGFGKVRAEWPVEIVGVVSATGTTGEVEVIGGRQYTVRTTVFGREFKEDVFVPVGQVVTAAVRVPTARLSVSVVDDDRKPIDRYVTSVEVVGPTPVMSATPPRDIEVLAGSYTVKVSALGKEASATVVLNPGEAKNLQIVVPGTAGLDFMGTRIPLPTLVLYALLLLVVIAMLVILMIEYNNWRRRRLMQILAPPK